MVLLHDLHTQYIDKQGRQYLVVTGDAKVYELLQSLKFEYGQDLHWLLPFPGDFHLLMNYQSALMKPYFDAGLKSLAEAAGYPVAAIHSCSQFKRTYLFILEAWEAVYQTMIAKFLEVSSLYKSSDQSDESCDLEGKIFEALETVKDTTIPEFRKAFNVMLAHTKTLTTPCYEEFIRHMAITDDTWKLWVQFVFVDAMAYVGLFLSIRSGDWHLRMGSMKNMAPVFTAFDHPIYQKLISNHISDLVCMPQPVLLMFEQGAFVVSIGGREWHSVAIDEAHEMLINKQCKMSITKPSPDYINRVAKYITYRTKAVPRFMQQLSPPEMKKSKVTKAWEVYFSSKSE